VEEEGFLLELLNGLSTGEIREKNRFNRLMMESNPGSFFQPFILPEAPSHNSKQGYLLSTTAI
jgi:hypothetical protein